MNDNTKVLDQNPSSVTQTDSGQPQAPVQPVAPVGGANKEMGGITAPVSEFVRPYGAEIIPNIPQEVSGSGVEVKSDMPDLTFEHKQIGLEHSGATVPVPPGPTGLVQIPQTKDISDSGTWLNALTEKVQKVLKLLGL